MKTNVPLRKKQLLKKLLEQTQQKGRKITVSEILQRQESKSTTKNEKVDVTYIYNGTPVKIKGINIFKRIKPKAKTEVQINT